MAKPPPASPAVPAAPPGRTAARVLWLDVARGIGIIFVVFGHTLGGLIDSPIGAQLGGFRVAFLLIYVFHMPLFFLLAGLMVRRRLERSQPRFAADLLLSLAYPYFLWSTVQYSAIFAAGSLVNSPVAHFWRPILRLPIATISQFWFLYVLFLLHGAALLLVPRIGARAFLGMAIVGRLAIAFVPLAALPRQFLTFGIFYALGLWIGLAGLERFRQWQAPRPWALAASLPVALGAVIGATWWTIETRGPGFFALKSPQIAALAWRLPTLPAALVAILAYLLVAMALRGPIARGLAWLGQRTMAIFLLHILMIAGVRILLNRFGHVHDPALLLAAAATAGLLLPLAVDAAARRLHLERVLGFGR